MFSKGIGVSSGGSEMLADRTEEFGNRNMIQKVCEPGRLEPLANAAAFTKETDGFFRVGVGGSRLEGLGIGVGV